MDCVNKPFKARITFLFRVDGGRLPSMTVLPVSDTEEEQQGPQLIPVIEMFLFSILSPAIHS